LGKGRKGNPWPPHLSGWKESEKGGGGGGGGKGKVFPFLFPIKKGKKNPVTPGETEEDRR